MGLICVVCLQSLISDPDPATSLSCGHIFHSTCIHQCLQASDHCPLCKKRVARSKMVSPLYFSTGNDDEDHTSSSANSSELRSKAQALATENKRFAKTVADLKHELSNVKRAKAEKESELNRVTKSMRYLKQIRKVAELDDSLASPTSQSYMKRLQQLSASDLLVNMGALEQRFKDATKERNEAVKKLSSLKKDNLHLTKKVQRLQQKLKDSTTTSAPPPGEYRPRRYPNVINLESEDEDDDEDDMPDTQNDDQRRDEQPNVSCPLTASSASVESLPANEESPMEAATSESSRISRQLSILSDNDLEFAVEEHSTAHRNPYNLKRSNNFVDRSMLPTKRMRSNSIIIDDQQ